MAGQVRTAISRDGTPIAYETFGDGPSVILVGGALADRDATAGLARALAPGFTAYSYDRRGRGDSGDTAPYAVDREIEDLAALVAVAGGAAHLVGFSSGAALALLAAADGGGAERLVLFEPPYSVPDGLPPPTAEYRARLAELTAADRRGAVVEYFLTEGVGIPEPAVTQMRDQPNWPRFEALAHTLFYDATVLGAGEVPGAAAAVAVPTLVVDSTGSPDGLRIAARAAAAAVPGARHVSLAGGWHEVPPETLAPVVTDFLTAHPG